MTTIRAVVIAIAALGVTTPAAMTAQQTVSGIVFLDSNGNGTRDAGERALPGIVVSNQDTVLRSGADGRFLLPSGTTGIAFVSVPDGYRSTGRWWRPTAGVAGDLEFGLAATPRVSSFAFVHASDTHIAPASIDRMHRLRGAVDSLHPAFVLIAGDLVRDALRVPEAEARAYYDLFAGERKKFTAPVWTVPGNHENFGIERDKSHVDPSNPLFGRQMYRSYFGPDYYSFTYGGVHFVGLNTVDIDGPSYYGHVDSLQMVWLERDLAMVPRSMPVVTFDHIPFATAFLGFSGYDDGPPAPSLITVRGTTVYRHTVSNAADVLAILRKHNHVLALGAHIHAGEKLVFTTDGIRTRFEQSPATIGPSQVGEIHFPSGVTLYRVRAGEIDAGKFVPLDAPPSGKTTGGRGGR